MRRNDRAVTDKQEIEEILKDCKTCHVAMTDGGIPYVVPLSFGYKFTEGGALELYFHSAYEGKKINALKANNKVCFAISNEGESINTEVPCDSGYYFSSVIGYGEAVFIEDAAGKCEGLSVMFKHQTGKDVTFNSSEAESVCVFKIVSDEYTGKRKLKSK